MSFLSLPGGVFRIPRLPLATVALAILCALAPPSFTSAADSCSCIGSPGGFSASTDVNCDGLPLSVADYVLLLRLIAGDTTVDSTCLAEMDGYTNSFFPCQPTIGDVVALGRVFTDGLSAAPTFNCDSLKEPVNSGLQIVMPGPIALVGNHSDTFTVSLHNSTSETKYIWAAMIPLYAKLIGSPLNAFNFQIESFSFDAGWDLWYGDNVDSTHTYGSVYPSQIGVTYEPTPIAPGETVALFNVSMDWSANGRAAAIPELYAQASNVAPYVCWSAAPDGEMVTGILTLTTDEPCCGMGHDVNGDGKPNIADVSYLVGYIFADNPTPQCLAGADVNYDGQVNIADVTALVEEIFVIASTPICGTCSLLGLEDPDILDFNGDINVNSIAYEIADWLVLTNYILGEPNLLEDPAWIVSVADVDFDCNTASIGDLRIFVRIIRDGLAPPVGPPVLDHYVKSATVSMAGDTVTVDSTVSSVLMTFAGDVNAALLNGDLEYASLTVDNYTRVLVQVKLNSAAPFVFSGSLITTEKMPISVQATDSLGALYNVQFDPNGP